MDWLRMIEQSDLTDHKIITTYIITPTTEGWDTVHWASDSKGPFIQRDSLLVVQKINHVPQRRYLAQFYIKDDEMMFRPVRKLKSGFTALGLQEFHMNTPRRGHWAILKESLDEQIKFSYELGPILDRYHCER
jgi:hypothetical protein